MKQTTVTKVFDNLPFAHRQHTHTGHCAQVHGHTWAFHISFACSNRDSNNFVVDFGKLGFIREWLNDNFDHTLVLSKLDPESFYFSELEKRNAAKLVLVGDTSCEGLAEYVFRETDEMVQQQTSNRAWVTEVTCFEGDKNSATFKL